MHVGCLFVHVYHGGQDGFFWLMFLNEGQGFLKECSDLRAFPALEELRAGGHQNLNYADAVLPGAAPRRDDLTFGLGPVLPSGSDEMEIQMAAVGVNVWVAGVLLFGPLIVGLNGTDLRPLIFGEA